MKRPQAQGFINAVLRRYTREHVALEAALPDEPAVRLSHPAWLVEQLRRDWPDSWPAILAANNAQGPLTLRVNRRRLSRDAYLQRLARSEEHTSELQSLMRISYAVFCLKKKQNTMITQYNYA